MNQTKQKSQGQDWNLFKVGCPYYETLNDIVVSETIKAINEYEHGNKPLRILDLGSGTGATATRLIEEYVKNSNKKKIILTLLDISEESMEYAKTVLQNTDTIEIEYIVEDACSYFKNCCHQFGIIYSVFVLHNFHPEPRREIMEQIGKAQGASGVFINADKIANDNEKIHRQQYDKTIQHFTGFLTAGRPDLYQERKDHYEADDVIRRNESEYLSILKDNGYKLTQDCGRFLTEKVFVHQKQSL